MDSLSGVSCGEVLLLTNGNLTVCCTLCENKNFAFDVYAEHVKKNHCLSDYEGDFLENYESDAQNLSQNLNSSSEANAPLVSEEYLRMFDELEFVAPEPNNCREIEDFVISFKKEERERIEPLTNASSEPDKCKQKRKLFRRKQKYKCQRCKFVTIYLSSMRSHIQRHDGVRPFRCSQCSKAFYTQTELENHTRTHTRARPYLCTTCGQTYITSFALWRHRKSCNNIRDKECTKCDAKFVDMRCLREHMATHSNLRKFICENCNASFKLRKTLISHIKIHENKREYKCKLCFKSFNQAPSLSSHMKTKH